MAYRKKSKRTKKAKKKAQEQTEKTIQEMQRESECADFVGVCVKDSEDYLRHYWDKYDNYYQLYRNIPNENLQNYSGRANLFIPEVYSVIETIKPRLVANKPTVTIAPQRPEYLQGAKDTQLVTDYYWREMGMKRLLKKWVTDGLLYGQGVLKLTWKKDQFVDRPFAQVLDVGTGEVLFDPTKTDPFDPRCWWIHRYEATREEIVNNPNYTIPTQDLESLFAYDSGGSNELGDYYKDFREFILGAVPGKDTGKKVAKIWEYWGLYEDENGDMVPHLIVVLNKKYIIRKEKNPYKHGLPPFIMFTDVDVPHKIIGIGEVEPLESLQYELNDTRNQRMDNVTQILHRMWKIQKGADIEEDELVWRPNGLVHVGMMDGLQPIDVPDVTRSAYNEETLIKQDMALASGVTDFQKGMGNQSGSQANETARGMAMQLEVGDARFQLKLDNLEDALVHFGKMLVQLCQQYMPDDLVIRITGSEDLRWKQLTKEDIKGQYDIIVEMGATQPMNKLTRRADARDLIATVAPYLTQMPGGVQKLNGYLKFLEQTYDMPEEVVNTQIQEVPQGPEDAIGSTPGQAGLNLAPNEEIYGQIGAQQGGSVPGQRAPELKRLGVG